MTIFSKNAGQLIDKYKFWVCRNPEKVRFMENYAALLLSLIAGKITKSNVPYDWISLGTRLLTFFNNHILNAPDPEEIPDSDRIKIFTTILEFAEICMERTVQSISGETARWRLVYLVQSFKFMVKLMVHFYYKERIVCCPFNYLPIDFPKNYPYGFPQDGFGGNVHDLSTHFVLKRSGRVVRMVHSAPPLYSRLWKPPKMDGLIAMQKKTEKMILTGEAIYIFKPIVTILAMKKYGFRTWKPWTIAFVMDVISLYLINFPYTNPQMMLTFTPTEREEMGRRLFGIFAYLIKSPFYERITRDRLKSMLSVIPFFGDILIDHLDHYLPTYFFHWSK